MAVFSYLQQGLLFVAGRQQHAGANITAESLKGVSSVSGWVILRRMLKHVWPKDRPDLKKRVVAAVVLLVGAKVL